MRFKRPMTERAVSEFSIAGWPMLEALSTGKAPPCRLAVVMREEAIILRVISPEFLLEGFDPADLVLRAGLHQSAPEINFAHEAAMKA